MKNCPDCMTDENAIGEGVRCAAHEIAFLKKRLIESESLTSEAVAREAAKPCPFCSLNKGWLEKHDAEVLRPWVEAVAEFRRCVDSSKNVGDHSDEDESCEEGMCVWIGEKLKSLLSSAPAPVPAAENKG